MGDVWFNVCMALLAIVSILILVVLMGSSEGGIDD